MKKYIRIEWDEKRYNVEHSEGLLTQELLGVLEVIKLNLWEKKQPKEED